MVEIVSIVLMIVGVYLIFGLVFGLIFIDTGLSKVDDGAQDTSWKFRLLIIPGLLVFWPLFAVKWWRKSR